MHLCDFCALCSLIAHSSSFTFVRVYYIASNGFRTPRIGAVSERGQMSDRSGQGAAPKVHTRERDADVRNTETKASTKTSEGNDSVSLAWLEDALGHAYAHGQMKALAYLEWVMEDVVFVMEMAAARPPTVG